MPQVLNKNPDDEGIMVKEDPRIKVSRYRRKKGIVFSRILVAPAERSTLQS
jgi:hypothetical protein